ncbi:MAG TPA: hypothetical protein VMB25_20830 [Bryobacteraceae bacterium]|nr:hypothetical protein [Bryobacteraceae bacterium]
MKTLAKTVGAILVCLVLALVVLRITGLNPTGDTPGRGNYPGLWLSGNVVTTPVTDWSFADQYKTDKLQTRTWYLIPHSVTTGHIVHNGQLYITSFFPAGMPFPQGKSWVKNVMRDPHVRLKFGNNLYDCVLSPVTDPDERAAVLGPRAKQNPQLLASAPGGPVMHLFHVLPQ